MKSTTPEVEPLAEGVRPDPVAREAMRVAYRALLELDHWIGAAVPVIEEGQAPPVGPLSGGSGATRTGRRREFGLRGLG